MSKKAEAEVPTMYPLRGEHRKPEKAKEGIIDLSKKKDKQVKEKKGRSKEKEKIEIVMKKEESERVDDDIIPLPVVRKERIQSDILPNRYPVRKPKDITEEIENYEGLLKPTPIEIELRGQLPPFDVDRELNFEVPKLIPTKKDLGKEKVKLMDHISGGDLFGECAPEQVELEKFYKSFEREGYSWI